MIDIWMSIYNIDNKDPQQTSELTKFQSLDDVVALMGPDHIARSAAMVIYGDDYHRTCFSKIRVKYPEDVTNGS